MVGIRGDEGTTRDISRSGMKIMRRMMGIDGRRIRGEVLKVRLRGGERVGVVVGDGRGRGLVNEMTVVGGAGRGKRGGLRGMGIRISHGRLGRER